MIGRILKDSTLYTVPVIVARGVNFLLLPVYTRILNPGQYGVLDLLMIVGGLVNLVLPLEISQGAARYTAQAGDDAGRKSAYASTALRFTAASYLAFVAAAFVFAPRAAAGLLGDAGYAGIVRLAAVAIALNGLHALLLNQLKWELRSRAYAGNHLVFALGSALASFLAAYVFGRGLAGILEGMIAGAVAATAAGVWQLRGRVLGPFDRAALREMLAYSAPLAVSGVGVFVNTCVDRLMLNRLLSLESVGIYGMALRLAGFAGLATVGVQAALSPIVFARHADAATKPALARLFRWFVAGALLLVLVLSLFAREILRLVATPAFYAAAPLVGWLTAALLLAGMYVFAPGLGLAKKTLQILAINVGGGVLNLLLNLLLIPRLGVAGAAYATLAAAAAVFAAYLVLSHRVYPVAHAWTRLALGVAAVGALAAIGARCTSGGAGGIGAKVAVLATAVPVLVGLGLVRLEECRSALRRIRR